MHIHLPLLKEVVSSYKYSSKVSIKLLGFNWVLYLIEGRKIFKYGTYSALYGIYHIDINMKIAIIRAILILTVVVLKDFTPCGHKNE